MQTRKKKLLRSLSFCLRDSARGAPYTFGTQFNGILQSPLPHQFLSDSGGFIGLYSFDGC